MPGSSSASTATADRAARKRQLILKSHLLRTRLVHGSTPLVHALSTAESMCGVLGRLRQHPEWLAGGLLVLSLLRPARIAASLRGTTQGLRSWRRLQAMLASLRR